MEKESKSVAIDFLNENKSLIKHLIENEHYTYNEIVAYFADQIDLEPWWVGEFSRSNKFCAFKNRSYSKLGDKNPAKDPQVASKISAAIKQLWEDGIYKDVGFTKDRNCAKGKHYMKNIHFKMINNYKEKLEFYQPEKVCMCCGKDLTNCKYDIHHVDENHNNILLTNLEKLCVGCHQKYHLRNKKQPYVIVEINHELQYGHRLPDYDGKCFFTHGHRGIITIRVRRRINPVTGFAIDFNDLKLIINEEIDKVLDHEYLNNYMDNPTTEFSVIWLWTKLSKVLKGIESISWAEGSKTQITLTKDDMNNAVLNGLYEVEWIPAEYRESLDYDIDLHTDLPDIDHIDDFTISTSLNNSNWLWFYNMVQALNKEEIIKEEE